MADKINPSNVDLPEIDLSQYGISEGAGIEFSITMKDPAQPDRVHVVYARDKQPGPDWVPFQFKFTHGNIRSKTLFVHKDELPYCENYKKAQNPSFKKAEVSKKNESIYFFESVQVMEFIRLNRSETFKNNLERKMPSLDNLLNELNPQKNNGESLQMRMFESSKQRPLNRESLLEGVYLMLMNR